MKLVIVIVALAVGAIGTLAVVRASLRGPAASQQQNETNAVRTESPLACDMQALTPEIRKRHFDELGPALRSVRKSVRELPDGYELEFPADANTYAMVTEWSIQERACCPFFNIDIRLDSEGGPMWLRLTGRDGTKQFIQGEAAAWIKKG